MQYHYEILTFLAYMLTLAALVYCSYQIGKTKSGAMEDLWSKEEDIIQDDLEPESRPEFFMEEEVAAGTYPRSDVESATWTVWEDPFLTGLPLTKENFEYILRINANPPVPSEELKKALQAGSYSTAPDELSGPLKLEPLPDVKNPRFGEKSFKKAPFIIPFPSPEQMKAIEVKKPAKKKAAKPKKAKKKV